MGLEASKPKILASVSSFHKTTTVEAGKKTLVCIVHVSLPKKFELCPRKSDTQVPRPICNVKSDVPLGEDDLGWVGLNVQEAREERTATSKVFRVSVYAMKSGRRVLEISFPNDFDVVLEGGRSEVALVVHPSAAYTLLLREVKDERGVPTPEVFVESLASIYVVASDQYGNLCDGNDLDLSLFNQDSLQLVSSTPVLYERGTYELVIQCLTEGAYVVEIGFTGMARPLKVPLRALDKNPLRRVWRRSFSDSFVRC